MEVDGRRTRQMRDTRGVNSQGWRRKSRRKRRHNKRRTGFKILTIDTEDGPVAVKVPVKSRKRRKVSKRKKKVCKVDNDLV